MNIKQSATAAFFNAGRFSGANAISRYLQKQKLLVLCYHGVVAKEILHESYLDNEEAYLHRNAISLSKFRAQMQLIAKCFHPITAQDLVNWMDGNSSLPDYPVLVTFDDGFQNNADYAVPVLRQFGIPALFNLPTEYIGQVRVLWPMEVDQIVLSWRHKTIPMPEGNGDVGVSMRRNDRFLLAEKIRSRCKRLPNEARNAYLDQVRSVAALDRSAFDRDLVDFMDWPQVRKLAHEGFDIGSHSVTHPILSKLTDDELRQELTESKKTIERELNQPCRWITYPNGQPSDFSPRVAEMAAAMGYELGFTLVEKFVVPDSRRFEIGRFNVTADTSLARFESIISGVYSLFKSER